MGIQGIMCGEDKYYDSNKRLYMIHDYEHGNRRYYKNNEELEAVHYCKGGKIDGLRLEGKEVEYRKDGGMTWKLPISEFYKYYEEELMDGLAMSIKASAVAYSGELRYVEAIHGCVELHHEKGRTLSFETETPPHL